MHVLAKDHRATPDVPRERRTVAEPLVEMIVAMLDPTLAVDDLMRVGADPAIRELDPTLAARVPSALMWHARYRLKSWSDVEPPSTDAARGGAGWRARARCT